MTPPLWSSPRRSAKCRQPYWVNNLGNAGVKTGGAEGNRTLDLCIANAALSQLSYRPNEARDSSIVVRYDRASAANLGKGMLAIGSRAPEFTLPDHDDRTVSLSTLLNRGPLILYFYPADFTPGCTREACMLRDMHAEILRVGLAVAGVSPQSPERHREFRDKYKLPFTLLSDVEKFVVRMYDLNGPLGLGVRRGTYLIDQARVIRSAILADFRISQHEDFVRKATLLSGNARPIA